MAFFQLSSMSQSRGIQKYYLSLRASHQRNDYAYWSATCKFSKTSGPVRYIPRSIKLPNLPADSGRTNYEHPIHDDMQGMKKISPEKIQHMCEGTNRAKAGRDFVKGKLDLYSGSVFYQHEEKNMCGASMNTQHASDSKNAGESFSRGSFVDLEIPMSMQQLQRHGEQVLLDSSHDSKEDILVRTGLFQEEQENMSRESIKAWHATGCQERNARDTPKSSQQTRVEGKKEFSYQDIEKFLLKAQKAKRRGVEAVAKSETTSSVNDSFWTADSSEDVGDDTKHVVLEQETLGDADSTIIDVKSTAAQEHAKNQAIRYLSMRPYTAFQLRKKLESRSISPKLADYAVAIIQKCGLQSDLAYAEMFSRSRFNHGSWGPKRIQLVLKQRGISDEAIQVALAGVFREEENESEQCRASENGCKEMSEAAMKHLLLQATKQWNRGRGATNETKVRRMVHWLQYRGFSYNVVKTVLNHVQKGICIEDQI